MDDTVPNPLAEPITADEFLAFLKEREVQEACPRCNKYDWTTDLADNPKVKLPVGTWSGPARGPGWHVPALRLVCDNCGFIALHALGIVIQWREQKRARLKDEDGKAT
jgi:hypothetical protein